NLGRDLATSHAHDQAEDADNPPPSKETPARSGAHFVLASQFSPQDVLAQRFRIVRFIGRGGMGEVYEAEDLELHEHVALKTIRAEIAPDARSIQRFKREINLARRVTHRNVCRTFDVFRHVVQLPDATTRETAFLTMELLEGETLAERLRRAGG